MAMAWRQISSSRAATHGLSLPKCQPGSCRFFAKWGPYAENVGIPEFLKGIGKGVETHVAKIETEIGDFEKLLVTRTFKLKKLGIPCKQRKLILDFANKYQLGLWRPKALPPTPLKVKA